MKYELTENEIKKAQAQGAKRWTRENKDRLYLTPEFLGGGRDRTGVWLPLDGDFSEGKTWYSRKRSYEITTWYIDLKNGELVADENWAQYVALVDTTIGKLKPKSEAIIKVITKATQLCLCF